MRSASANQPILLTKLIPPSPGKGLIQRDRLLSLLNEALSYPIVLIAAPTGYGKTTSLSVFASRISTPIAWLSLEEQDDDPVRFWSYFFAGLTRVIPDLRLDAPIIIPGMGLNALSGSLDALCNRMTEISQPIVYVLDDFQLISHADILQGMAYWIDHTPANFHLVISTRQTPALPITRLRAKNRFAEIRPPELNFTEAEAKLFFESSGDAGLSCEQIRQVMSLTHGWAAGIRLMGVALREDPNHLDAWKEGEKLAVDYLTSELIEQLPQEWVIFLEKIAIFDAFTLETVSSLAGSPDAASLLNQMLQANLFLDHRGDVWRFHPFFREAILQKLTEAELSVLHSQAAAWFETHSLQEKAIWHALAGKDWDCAIRLIFSQVENNLQKGEIHTLQNWLLLIPENLRAANPDLQVLQGWVSYWLGKVPEAHQIVRLLEGSEIAGFIQNKGLWAGLRCQLALVQEQNQLALDLAQLALNETDPSSPFIRGILLSMLASSQQALGDSEGAIIHFKQSILANRTAGNLMMAFFSLISLGIELNEMGQRRKAMALCAEVLEDVPGDQDHANHIFSGLIDLLSARLYWESNQVDEGQKLIDQSTAKLELLGIPGLQISGELIRAQILTAREEFAEALNLINKNRRRTRTGEFIGFRQLFDLLRAEIFFKMGNLAGVKDWLDGAGLPDSPFDDPAREQEFILKARYLLEIGSIDESSRLLDELSRYCAKVHHIRISIAVLLTQATLEWKKGDLGQVKTLLEEALALAAPEEYIRILLDYAGPLLGLLARLPGAPAEIRARFRAVEPPDQAGLIEMLTAREMEILRLLAENKTNPEIARQLVLSGETVKVHLKHIFQKLAVTDRRQAVRRARELDLI
jgi:LuxR family transcriptional regulator, maltose regulon positive regulatory protein